MGIVHFNIQLGGKKRAAAFAQPQLGLIGGGQPMPASPPAGSPVVDLASYPVLTEEVGFAPSPLARGGSSGLPTGITSGGSSLGQMVNKAVSDVLGWKVKAGDTKGFVGALTQSFTVTEVAGHVESKWTPRTYAVQTDLNGGLSGAQLSIYSRAKVALEQSLPLLDGLYKLDPEAVDEDIAALKAVVKNQLTEMVNEMGYLGGPRIVRVNQYFNLLLGSNAFPTTPPPNNLLTVTDPDQIQGTLGNLRDELGVNFVTQARYFVNSVEDETNLSNYRVISDYVTSLAQSWLNNVGYLVLNTPTPFFGTQLVLLSRQLSVVAESVDEVRFTLDSVFIGPAERQSTELRFKGNIFPPIFLEDLLSWVQNFATEEGPRLVQDGGKFGVQNTFTQVAAQLLQMVKTLLNIADLAGPLPPGFFSQRVQLSITDLKDQLTQLVKLAKPIQQVITPQPDFALPAAVLGVSPNFYPLTAIPGSLYINGSGFFFGAQPTAVFSTKGSGTPPTVQAFFQSESLLFAKLLNPGTAGAYDLIVTNGDGVTQLSLQRALTITNT